MVSNQTEEALGLPLDGVKVLDLSLQLPGPYATWLLHGLGAEVDAVEPPGGDQARVLDRAMHATLSAGKRVHEIDLRSEAGVAAFQRLVRECDVFIEGFRPGVAERLGFSFDELSALRPELIYCSLSGYGQEGPYRDVPGHDVNYLGVAGAVEMGDGTDGPQPQKLPVVDLAAGTTAALSIVAALRRRERDGQGCYLDLAMLDCAVAWSSIKTLSGVPEAAYGLFEAADGLFLSLGVLEDKFWHALCATMGWPEWSADPMFATPADRQARAVEIDHRLRLRIAELPRAEWLRRFEEADVPAAPAHTRDAAATDAQIRERGLLPDGRPRVPLPAAITRPSPRVPAGVPGR
jgi:crotonobetainyl-CoA:carnitine CoA-transferase CaiB-like acyl-CoA transferase